MTDELERMRRAKRTKAQVAIAASANAHQTLNQRARQLKPHAREVVQLILAAVSVYMECELMQGRDRNPTSDELILAVATALGLNDADVRAINADLLTQEAQGD